MKLLEVNHAILFLMCSIVTIDISNRNSKELMNSHQKYYFEFLSDIHYYSIVCR